MEEEFHESDVVFSEKYPQNCHSQSQNIISTKNNQLGKKKKIKKKQKRNSRAHQSPPLDIPDSIRYVDVMEYDECWYDDDDDDDSDLEESRLPPHLIVAHRINNYYNLSRKMACSFCAEDEKGRVLKGRNLFEVRNSILRLTGFIET